MIKFSFNILLLIILFPAFSCNNRQEQHATSGTKNMFDLQQYMQQEWQRINTEPNGFIRISGKKKYTDTTAISANAAKQYFDELAAAYPGKKNASKYNANTVEDNVTGNLTIIYTAINNNTNPYQIELNLDINNSVKSIYVTYYKQNIFWQSSKKIFYSVSQFFSDYQQKKDIILA